MIQKRIQTIWLNQKFNELLLIFRLTKSNKIFDFETP